MWGAFGRPPPSTPPEPPPPAQRLEGAPDQVGPGADVFSSVHGVELSRDGLVYVSDRDSQRIQVFDRRGRFKTQVFINRNAPNRQTASGLGLSPDRAQRWLYVVDFGNCHIDILERRTLRLAQRLGECGRQPGQFIGPHLLSVDSTGAIYVAEVQGRRVQKLHPALARRQ
jgi:sugar lactone lactonase YvrE